MKLLIIDCMNRKLKVFNPMGGKYFCRWDNWKEIEEALIQQSEIISFKFVRK